MTGFCIRSSTPRALASSSFLTSSRDHSSPVSCDTNLNLVPSFSGSFSLTAKCNFQSETKIEPDLSGGGTCSWIAIFTSRNQAAFLFPVPVYFVYRELKLKGASKIDHDSFVLSVRILVPSGYWATQCTPASDVH